MKTTEVFVFGAVLGLSSLAHAENFFPASSDDVSWGGDINLADDLPVPAISPDILTASVTNNGVNLTFLGERGIPYTVYSNGTLGVWGWTPMNIVPHELGETNGVYLFNALVQLPFGQVSGFYRVFGGNEQRYMIVDVSGGPSAENYPVTYQESIPEGGWSETYKTTKIVLMRMPAGRFTMGSPTGESRSLASTFSVSRRRVSVAPLSIPNFTE